MSRPALGRREFLSSYLRPRGAVARKPLKVRSGGPLHRFWRPALFVAALVCWFLCLTTTVDLTAADGATAVSVGIQSAPWLTFRIGDTGSLESLRLNLLSGSVLSGLCGNVLLKAYSRPRVLAAFRRLFREIVSR